MKKHLLILCVVFMGCVSTTHGGQKKKPGNQRCQPAVKIPKTENCVLLHVPTFIRVIRMHGGIVSDTLRKSLYALPFSFDSALWKRRSKKRLYDAGWRMADRQQLLKELSWIHGLLGKGLVRVQQQFLTQECSLCGNGIEDEEAVSNFVGLRWCQHGACQECLLEYYCSGGICSKTKCSLCRGESLGRHVINMLRSMKDFGIMRELYRGQLSEERKRQEGADAVYALNLAAIFQRAFQREQRGYNDGRPDPNDQERFQRQTEAIQKQFAVSKRGPTVDDAALELRELSLQRETGFYPNDDRSFNGPMIGNLFGDVSSGGDSEDNGLMIGSLFDDVLSCESEEVTDTYDVD